MNVFMDTKIEDIVIARLNGQKLSVEEEGLFEEWYTQPENWKQYYEWEKLQAAIYANAKVSEISTDKAWKRYCVLKQHSVLHHQLLKYAAVAVVLFCIGITFYWLRAPQETAQFAENVSIEPGKKQAVLTLSSGEKISLSDSLHQRIIKENGIVIRNDAPNMLVYDKPEESQQMVYNTIYIPRGEEYKLTLSDGTTVWLNSESQLTYPVAFNGNNRELRLEGEAYFDVAKDQSKPFIVHTRQFDIRVTGTQFNVRTYLDEPESATLTEGHIQLEKGSEIHLLVPGQQAIVGTHSVTVSQVNPEEAIAWRYEAFCFKQCRLENIMNELGRWYDLEIFYLNPRFKELHFTAWFRRNSSISEVIEVLEKTQKIKVELKGKTLTVR